MAHVGIIMGSTSDLPIMQEAIDILKGFDIEVEVDIVSAHRTPEKMFDYGTNAHKRGIKVIIAGAGGAAHLPGMIASLSPLPVIGVPVKSRNSIDGWDSVLSILQMPGGVPVATVALDGAKNAGILAAQIIGTSDSCVLDKIEAYKEDLEAFKNYQIEHNNSPPILRCLASRLVKMPFEVDKIITPIPPSTWGMSLEFEYRRKPGLLIRCKFVIQGFRVCLSYFKLTVKVVSSFCTDSINPSLANN